MPETDAEMMARLERMTTWDCDGYLSVEDSAAIRHALALIERYRGALRDRMPAHLTTGNVGYNAWDAGYNACADAVRCIVDSVLWPSDAPAETEAKP